MVSVTDEVVLLPASVSVVGTRYGAISDANGRFGINKLQQEMSWGSKRVQAALAVLQSRGAIIKTPSGARLVGSSAQL